MNRKERRILRMIAEEYKKRLTEVAIKASLSETDAVDKKGNILLSKGLKVRHKKSEMVFQIASLKRMNIKLRLFKVATKNN